MKLTIQLLTIICMCTVYGVDTQNYDQNLLDKCAICQDSLYKQTPLDKNNHIDLLDIKGNIIETNDRGRPIESNDLLNVVPISGTESSRSKHTVSNLLLPCGHIFHAYCYNEYLISKVTQGNTISIHDLSLLCPLCKTPFTHAQVIPAPPTVSIFHGGYRIDNEDYRPAVEIKISTAEGFESTLTYLRNNPHKTRLRLSTTDDILSIPEHFFENLTQLTLFGLTNSRITELPASFGLLLNLKEIDINTTKISKLPDSIGDLVNLQVLSVANSELTSVPDSIGNLGELKSLYLDDNNLTSLPDTICNLGELKDLCLSDNKLTSLPSLLSNLTSLEECILSSNTFTKIPTAILNLPALEMVNLNDNHISDMSDITASSFPALKTLWLKNNNLKKMPKELGQLKRLETLFLSGNGVGGDKTGFRHNVNIR